MPPVHPQARRFLRERRERLRRGADAADDDEDDDGERADAEGDDALELRLADAALALGSLGVHFALWGRRFAPERARADVLFREWKFGYYALWYVAPRTVFFISRQSSVNLASSTGQR